MKPFTKEQVANLLCSAFEGGSNYWYLITEFGRPIEFKHYTVSKKDIYRHIDYPMNPLGYLTIEILDNDEVNGKKSWKLNRSTLKKGEKIMHDKYLRHWSNVVSGDDDAETGDVFLQCCLFGEVVFG